MWIQLVQAVSYTLLTFPHSIIIVYREKCSICWNSFLKFIFIYGYVTCVQVLQRPEEGIRCPDLELEVVDSHLMWVLGAKFWSSGRIEVFLTVEPFLHPLSYVYFFL